MKNLILSLCIVLFTFKSSNAQSFTFKTNEKIFFDEIGTERTVVGIDNALIGAKVVAANAVNGNVGVGTVTPTSKLHVVGLPTYTDNATALLGGLTVGAFYKTSLGVLMIVY